MIMSRRGGTSAALHKKLLLAACVVSAVLLAFAPAPASAQDAVDGITEVFLCGFEAQRDCDFSRGPTCQLFQIGECTRFASTAFEEFGLEELFVRVDRDNDTYSYQVFITDECTGDPYGIRVRAEGLHLDECSPLILQFVGNQADFIFVLACDQCDRGSSIVPNLLGLPDGVVSIDYPRKAGSLISAATSNICEVLGMGPPPSSIGATTVTAPVANPLAEPHVWQDGSLVSSATVTSIARRIWCNETTEHVSEVGPATFVTGTTAISFRAPFASVPAVQWTLLSFCCINTPPTPDFFTIADVSTAGVSATLRAPYTVVRVMLHAFIPGTDAAVARVDAEQMFVGHQRTNPWPFSIGLLKDTSPVGVGARQDHRIHYTPPHVLTSSSPSSPAAASLSLTLAPSSVFTGDATATTPVAVNAITTHPTNASITAGTTWVAALSPPTRNLPGVAVSLALPEWLASTTTTASSPLSSTATALPPTVDLLADWEAVTDTVLPGHGPRLTTAATALPPPIPPTVLLCEYGTRPRCSAGGPTVCHRYVPEQCQPLPPTSALHASFASVRPDWADGSLQWRFFTDTSCISAITGAAVTAAFDTCFTATAAAAATAPPSSGTAAVMLRAVHTCDAATCFEPTGSAPAHPVIEAETMTLLLRGASEAAWEVATFTTRGQVLRGLRTTRTLSTQIVTALINQQGAPFADGLRGQASASLYLHARCAPLADRVSSVLLGPRDHVAHQPTIPIVIPCTGDMTWVHAGTLALTPLTGTMQQAPSLSVSLRNVADPTAPLVFVDKLALAPLGTPPVPSLLQGQPHPPCTTLLTREACPVPRCEWNGAGRCQSPTSARCGALPATSCPADCQVNTTTTTTSATAAPLASAVCELLDGATSNPALCSEYVLHVAGPTANATDSGSGSGGGSFDASDEDIVVARVSDLITPVARVQRWVSGDGIMLVHILWSANMASTHTTPTAAVMAASVSDLSFPQSITALLASPDLLAIAPLSSAASSSSSSSSSSTMANDTAPISPALTASAPLLTLDRWALSTLTVACRCARVAPSVSQVAPTRAVVAVETAATGSAPPTIDVALSGGRGFWDWDGFTLVFSQLMPDTTYTVTIGVSGVGSSTTAANSTCRHAASSAISFHTPPLLPNLDAVIARPLSPSEVLFQWTVPASTFVDVASTLTGVNVPVSFQSLFFRVFVDGAPITTIPALSAEAPTAAVSPSHGDNTTSGASDVSDNGSNGAQPTPTSTASPCYADSRGGPYLLSKLISATTLTPPTNSNDDDGDDDDVDVEVLAFELLVQQLPAGTRHRFSVQLVHPSLGPLSRRSLPVTATTISAAQRVARVRFNEATTLGPESESRAVWLQWEPTVLQDGTRAAAYHVLAEDLSLYGVRTPVFEDIVTSTGVYLRVNRLFEVAVRPLFLSCWLPAKQSCLHYLDTSTLPPATAINGTQNVEFSLTSVPVILTHTIEGDGSVSFLLAQELQITGSTFWVVRDSNNRTTLAPRANVASISRDQATVNVRASLLPYTTYAFTFHNNQLRSRPYHVLTAQAPPSRPSGLSPTDTTTRSISLQLTPPDPLNGVLLAYRVHLSTVTDNSTRPIAAAALPAARLPGGGIGAEPLVLVVDGLQAARAFSLNVTARTEAGEGPGIVIEVLTAAVDAVEDSSAQASSSLSSASSSSSSSSSSRPVSNGGMVAAALSGVAVGAVAAVLLWRAAERRVRAGEEARLSNATLQEELAFVLQKRFDGSSVGQVAATDLPSLEVRPTQVIFRRSLTTGRFGAVHDAIFKGQPVIAHRLHTNNRMFDVASLVAEARVLGALHHPNIIEVLGIASQRAPVLILHEKSDLGDLKRYVQQEGERRALGPQLRVPDLLDFAQQIADGMQHLHEHGVMNGALQLDMLLLSRSKKVKIHRLARLDSYQSPFPVVKFPWKALELLSGASDLTKATDVWAFGVVMWELLTNGQKPFAGMSEQDVLAMLSSGQRLSPPSAANDRMRALMMSCWHQTPAHRPVFPDLVDRLESEIAIQRGAMEHHKAQLNKKYNFGGPS